MAQQAFPYTIFNAPSGAPLSGGYVLISISTDVQTPSGQLCAGMTLRVDLDSNGAMIDIPQVWANSSLSPSGSCYLLTAFTAEGEAALGPLPVTV